MYSETNPLSYLCASPFPHSFTFALLAFLFSWNQTIQRGKKNKERGKVFIRVPSALGQPPAEDGCSQCSTVYWPTDRPTDWLTDWRVCLFTRKNNSALSSGPTASPPSCAQHPDRFLFQRGNPLGVADTLPLLALSLRWLVITLGE